MGEFCKASFKIKVAFVLCLMSCILHVIGFSTPYWIYQKHRRITSPLEDIVVSYMYGLWQACAIFHDIDGRTHCTKFKCDQIKGCNGILYAVQTFETLAFVSMLLVFFIVWVYMCKPTRRKVLIASVICLAAGILTAVGVALYANQDFVIMEYVNFSFILCSVASLGYLIVFILLILEYVSLRKAIAE